MSDPLHVTNGDVVADALAATSLPGGTLVWADVLHTGPLDFEPRRCRARRASFLARCGWGDESSIEAGLASRDEHLARSVREGRPIVLWFEHDLFDQLQLLQVSTALAEARLGQVELVQADTYLGSLEPPELEALWPTRAPIPRAGFEQATSVWRAVCDDDLDAALALDSHAIPYVAGALRRLQEERGLRSRTQKQLLRALADGTKTATDAYLASQSREEAVFLGDAWAFADLAELAAEGLVTTADGSALPPAPPRGDAETFAATLLALTPEGHAVA